MQDPKFSVPSPLEFYSYIYYFVNFLAGPFFEFDEYISFVDFSLFKKTKVSSQMKFVSLSDLSGGGKKGKIPFSWSAFGKSFIGIGISLLGIVIRPMVPYLTNTTYELCCAEKYLIYFSTQQPVCSKTISWTFLWSKGFPTFLSPYFNYGDTGTLWRFLYIYISYFGVRCNYYACWTISEAVSIVSGFGYRETPEGEVKW